MCCKLLQINEIAKPAGVWCPDVLKGRGCGIYETRPQSCREFRCNWLLHPGLDDSWRPDRAGFLLWTVSTKVLLVVVEPSKPDAWKRKPYYAQLKDWSKTALTGQGMVLVKVRNDTTVLLPQADVHIGDVAVSDQVTVGRNPADPKSRAWVEVARSDGSIARYETQ
jgi:hypothetical protein